MDNCTRDDVSWQATTFRELSNPRLEESTPMASFRIVLPRVFDVFLKFPEIWGTPTAGDRQTHLGTALRRACEIVHNVTTCTSCEQRLLLNAVLDDCECSCGRVIVKNSVRAFQRV